MGLLEAVSESSIQALADPTDTNHDGITGRVRMVTDPETGQPRSRAFYLQRWRGQNQAPDCLRPQQRYMGRNHIDFIRSLTVIPTADWFILADSDLC